MTIQIQITVLKHKDGTVKGRVRKALIEDGRVVTKHAMSSTGRWKAIGRNSLIPEDCRSLDVRIGDVYEEPADEPKPQAQIQAC